MNTEWVALEERNLRFREIWHFILYSKLVCPLLQQETLSPFCKTVHYTNILEKVIWYKSCHKCRNIRDSENQLPTPKAIRGWRQYLNPYPSDVKTQVLSCFWNYYTQISIKFKRQWAFSLSWNFEFLVIFNKHYFFQSWINLGNRNLEISQK